MGKDGRLGGFTAALAFPQPPGASSLAQRSWAISPGEVEKPLTPNSPYSKMWGLAGKWHAQNGLRLQQRGTTLLAFIHHETEMDAVFPKEQGSFP